MILRKSLIFVFAGFVLCLVPLMIPSCTHDPVGVELLDTVCFVPTVMGIIQGSCGKMGTVNCHNGAIEGWKISDTASIMALVENPGDPKGCTLYQVITDINSDEFMPPEHALSRQNRTLIQVWIAQGAPMNECGSQIIRTVGGAYK